MEHTFDRSYTSISLWRNNFYKIDNTNYIILLINKSHGIIVGKDGGHNNIVKINSSEAGKLLQFVIIYGENIQNKNHNISSKRIMINSNRINYSKLTQNDRAKRTEIFKTTVNKWIKDQ